MQSTNSGHYFVSFSQPFGRNKLTSIVEGSPQSVGPSTHLGILIQFRIQKIVNIFRHFLGTLRQSTRNLVHAGNRFIGNIDEKKLCEKFLGSDAEDEP